jgi:hypothetical protein
MFSTVVVLFTFFPTVDKGSFFTASLPTFAVCVIEDSHSDWSEVKSQCYFDFHFLYGVCISSFETCFFSLFIHLLIGLLILWEISF